MTASSFRAPDDELDEILDRTLNREELEDQSESSGEPVKVTFSTQDYPIDALVRRLQNGSMIIPRFEAPQEKVHSAKFQRGFVWTKKQMDKFIESLLLGYPIPGIFLVKQPEDNRLLVLDGQQRLETLRRFYEGIHSDRTFSLQNVNRSLQGQTYRNLDEEQVIALDNSFMQATIVSADGSDEVYDAIYQIFERLNSGGTQLTPHEIRIALFSGVFMESIARLNADPNWRKLYSPEPSPRLRDHELILRALAMRDNLDDYRRPLKTFLNTYAKSHRHDDAGSTSSGQAFMKAVADSRGRRNGSGKTASGGVAWLGLGDRTGRRQSSVARFGSGGSRVSR